MKEILINDCYTESGVSPKSVSFVEAYGNGTQVSVFAFDTIVRLF
jgi:acyl transferase domain-containing protein